METDKAPFRRSVIRELCVVFWCLFGFMALGTAFTFWFVNRVSENFTGRSVVNSFNRGQESINVHQLIINGRLSAVVIYEDVNVSTDYNPNDRASVWSFPTEPNAEHELPFGDWATHLNGEWQARGPIGDADAVEVFIKKTCGDFPDYQPVDIRLQDDAQASPD